jgi:hypothetical protein
MVTKKEEKGCISILILIAGAAGFYGDDKSIVGLFFFCLGVVMLYDTLK